MQECFASLLRVRGALVNLANEYKSVGLPSEIAVFLEPMFWSEMEEAEAVISPLSQASYRLQRDENTVADVLVSFRDIYFGFASNESYGHNLVRSVERRWAKCEQPLFLLGLFLHPELRADAKILMAALKDRKIHIDLIAEDCAVYYFRRFHGEDYGKLRVELEGWLQLKELQVRLTDYDKPAPAYWKYAKRFYPALAKLATTILSVAVNSASCERLFSSLGAIHSATRSKLAAEKAMQFHVVKKRVRDDAGSQQPPKKKKMRISEPAELTVKFAEALAEPADVQSDEDDSDEETTGHHVETFLHLQLALEAIFEDDDIASEYERCETSTNYSAYEPIPRPDMRPFDHPEFRQESKIIGFRAWSMSLSELFPLSSRSQYNGVDDESDSGSEWSCESPL